MFCIHIWCQVCVSFLFGTSSSDFVRHPRSAFEIEWNWLNLIWWGWKYFVAREYPLPPPCNSFIAGNLHRFGAIQLSFFSQQASPPHIWPVVNFSRKWPKSENTIFQVCCNCTSRLEQFNFPFPLQQESVIIKIRVDILKGGLRDQPYIWFIR